MGHFGLFAGVSGYFGMGGGRKLFWSLLIYTINFCFLSNPKFLALSILTQGHFGLYWAILGLRKGHNQFWSLFIYQKKLIF